MDFRQLRAALLNRVLIKYLLASVFALGMDMGSFLALLAWGMAPVLASVISYSIGIVGHWLASSRAVFRAGVNERGPERTKQKVQFVLSALVGLSLTAAIIDVGGRLGIDPRLSKLVAVGVAFVVTYYIRSAYIFAVGSDRVQER